MHGSHMTACCSAGDKSYSQRHALHNSVQQQPNNINLLWHVATGSLPCCHITGAHHMMAAALPNVQ
jgi:hypothetical protein